MSQAIPVTASGSVYITACGAYLPGDPIDNDSIEQYLGLIEGKPSRVRRRILTSNGIKSRHYALDKSGRTTELNEQLAAKAIQRALERRGASLADVELLALGTSLGDALVPGFASMVQGRLQAPPMEVLTAGGVCCSGMAALLGAYRALLSGTRRVAIAGGSELASRLLRATRFASLAGDGRLDFDSEFLRWMLSDGAGVVLLESVPRPDGLSLRIDWIDLVSRSGETPTCMSLGLAQPSQVVTGSTWLDYPTATAAEREGLLRVRQDVRMLDRVVELGLEHWVHLVNQRRLAPDNIDWFVSHHSSRLFEERLAEAMRRAGVFPAQDKWFTNLYTKGNTGAAAIFVSLEELVNSGSLQPGQTVVLGVPESGRYASCVAHLTVVAPDAAAGGRDRSIPLLGRKQREDMRRTEALRQVGDRPPLPEPPSPLASDGASTAPGSPKHQLMLALAEVWTQFNARLHLVPIVERIERGTVTLQDYRELLCQLRQQVIEGSRWIAQAAASTTGKFAWLRSMLIRHAAEEHRDYEMLERDFVSVGGDAQQILMRRKNAGSEALSAFMFQRARQADPLDLVGAMFIIEGLGMRRAANWADQLVDALSLGSDQVSFLAYHGSRDSSHLGHLEEVIDQLPLDAQLIEEIVHTARVTARLYALQLEEIDFALES